MWLKARLSGRKGSTMPLLFSDRCSCAFSGRACSAGSAVRDNPAHLAEFHIPVKDPVRTVLGCASEVAVRKGGRLYFVLYPPYHAITWLAVIRALQARLPETPSQCILLPKVFVADGSEHSPNQQEAPHTPQLCACVVRPFIHMKL